MSNIKKDVRYNQNNNANHSSRGGGNNDSRPSISLVDDTDSRNQGMTEEDY